MSTVTSSSRLQKDAEGLPKSYERQMYRQSDVKLETRLNIKDLEILEEAFMLDGEGYDNKLSLNREQFCEALSLIVGKGSREEYGELFDKIDVTKEGAVDWNKLASHMLLEFYEKDDRVKAMQVPQWKTPKHLASPHKDAIQRLVYLKNTNRYISISKEGCVAMWDQQMKLQRTLKTTTDNCRSRDLWLTYFTPLTNINKIALCYTSKEISLYDLSSKLEFNCQFRVNGLSHTPLCMDYWYNEDNPNEAILSWGDTDGSVNALHFKTASISLFERPSAAVGDKEDTCQIILLKDIKKKKYKSVRYTKHKGHGSEWVRQVRYSPQLECFISCSTTWQNSLVIGWLEKHGNSNNDMKTNETKWRLRRVERTTRFQISQGVNAFDYHGQLNLIATAGVNHHVCLWNPYVVSKPNGVLRGHMASVIQVQFNKSRSQLISFSQDKVLRLWDVQLQVCIQRLAGMFPKGCDMTSVIYFDERLNRLFVTFNYQLVLLEMKPEITDHVLSHDRPVVAALYNPVYNQMVSVCQGGSVVIWMIDSGQKVKTFDAGASNCEVTTLAQDESYTRLFIGSSDGTVKIWDFNGHCYHTLHCCEEAQLVDVGQVIVLKRSVLAVGWAKHITVFRGQSFKDFHVELSDWKGGQSHGDDILAVAFSPPSTLATGSYDGEIILWNNNSEQASWRLSQRRAQRQARSLTRSSTHEPPPVGEGGGERTGGPPSRPASRPPSRTPSRPRSRAPSRLSLASADDSNEYGYAVVKLAFLETRRGSPAGAANLVSCGGSGWVRFWSTARHALVGEFVAHMQVGSVVMAVDSEDHWLVTGDVDGLLKVWDISDHCVDAGPPHQTITDPPPMLSQFSAHRDMINSLDICVRTQRTLIISASSDCSVALWDINGNAIGVFGQEEHWKIEPHVPSSQPDDDSDEQSADEGVEVVVTSESPWEPDDQAIVDPVNFRLNSWNNSCLGKGYQELKVRKRERRQPQLLPQLHFLHWEKTGKIPIGPYGALSTCVLSEVETLRKPDCIAHPHRYFSDRPTTTLLSHSPIKLPSIAETLQAAFDEKTLFPKYILHYEAQMKQDISKLQLDKLDRRSRGPSLTSRLRSTAGQSSPLSQASSPSHKKQPAAVKISKFKTVLKVAPDTRE